MLMFPPEPIAFPSHSFYVMGAGTQQLQFLPDPCHTNLHIMNAFVYRGLPDPVIELLIGKHLSRILG